MTTYYLSGAMRGYPQLNFPAFERATKQLRAQGLTVMSPHEWGDISLGRGQLMGDDLLAIIKECDAVVLLPGWRNSPGACAEVAVAFSCEKPVFDIVEDGGLLSLVLSDCTSVTVPREEQYRNHVPLLGLCGFAQSGKDTIARHLISKGWTRVAFADALRDVLYALNPIVEGIFFPEGDGIHLDCLQDIVDDKGWDRAKVEHPEIRRLLQRLGTEAGRAVIDDNLWVGLGEQKIEAAGTPVVVTDCRFANEVQMVRRRGGKLIWVHRPGVGAVNGHASEHSVTADDCDRIIVNDQDIAHLTYATDDLIPETVGLLV